MCMSYQTDNINTILQVTTVILVIALLSSALIASVSAKKCGDSQLLGDYCDKCLRYVSSSMIIQHFIRLIPFNLGISN